MALSMTDEPIKGGKRRWNMNKESRPLGGPFFPIHYSARSISPTYFSIFLFLLEENTYGNVQTYGVQELQGL
jgi:hypothetical protein